MKLKRLHKLGFLFIALILAAGCTGGGEVKDPSRVVIRVGKRTVTGGRFDAALARLLPDGGKSLSEDELKTLRKDLALRLIEEELVLAEAERLGLKVSDEEIEAEEKSVREAAGPDFSTEVVKRFGSQEAWQRELRRELLIRKTIEKALEDTGKVKTREARRYYRKHIKDFDVPEMARASMIVVSSEEEARRIREALTPENFSTLAREKSLGPEAEKGGDLGFFARGEMPEEFEKAVFRLRPGEISDIVKTEYGYHIFLLREKKRGRRRTFKEVRDEIIKTMAADRREKRFNEWLESLKKSTPVRIEEDLF